MLAKVNWSGGPRQIATNPHRIGGISGEISDLGECGSGIFDGSFQVNQAWNDPSFLDQPRGSIENITLESLEG